MPRTGNLRRTDSLDPATTCRGLTSNGRPCRRPLGPSDNTGYCWQHKDQVPSTTTSGNAAHHAALTAQPNPRTSIDTLMERLNINDTQAQAPPKRSKKRSLLCCCLNLITGDDLSPPSKPVQLQPATKPTSKPPTGLGAGAGQLSWIPSTLSSRATSKLLAELDKPVSEKDEDGYIYMFWVTPSDSSRSAPPPADIGSALFPSPHIPEIRSIGDAIRAAQEYNAMASNPTDHSSGSIRLKIGRTNNVHRRINEWTKQCSHDLTLLRYYPYSSKSPSKPPVHGTGITVPYVHRVERLIHLELDDIRIRNMGPCPDCGKEHQEWFEVPAEKESLQWVDGSIRRWCDWAKNHKKNRRQIM